MCKALPVMAEDAEILKQRLQREGDGPKTPRLQMLSWLASGHYLDITTLTCGMDPKQHSREG